MNTERLPIVRQGTNHKDEKWSVQPSGSLFFHGSAHCCTNLNPPSCFGALDISTTSFLVRATFLTTPQTNAANEPDSHFLVSYFLEKQQEIPLILMKIPGSKLFG